MPRIKNPFIISALFFVMIFTLSTCKKYPENTLWFKNIKKINFFDNVKLTGFTVNGIDSLRLLGSYLGSNVPDKEINDTYFQAIDIKGTNLYGQGQFVLNGGSYALGVGYTYSKNKNKISLYYYGITSADSSFLKRNIFIDNNEWEIIKLEPKGTRKIKKTVNDNTYELQFDKL